MPHGSHYSRVLQLVTKTTDAFRVEDWTLNQIDPDGLRYVATVSVRVHWFCNAAVLLVELMYRPLSVFRGGHVSPALQLLLLRDGRVQRVHSLPSPVEHDDYVALDSDSSMRD